MGMGKAPAESDDRRVAVGARANRDIGAAMTGRVDAAGARLAEACLIGDTRRCRLSVDWGFLGLAML
jgi:hypothetical protein